MNLSYQGEANVISTCCFLHFTRVMREILHMTHLCGKIVFVKAVICLDKSPFEIQQILYYRESKIKKYVGEEAVSFYWYKKLYHLIDCLLWMAFTPVSTYSTSCPTAAILVTGSICVNCGVLLSCKENKIISLLLGPSNFHTRHC